MIPNAKGYILQTEITEKKKVKTEEKQMMNIRQNALTIEWDIANMVADVDTPIGKNATTTRPDMDVAKETNADIYTKGQKNANITKKEYVNMGGTAETTIPQRKITGG